MPQYLIERELPGAAALTPEQLRDIAQTSNTVVDSLGVPYVWHQSSRGRQDLLPPRGRITEGHRRTCSSGRLPRHPRQRGRRHDRAEHRRRVIAPSRPGRLSMAALSRSCSAGGIRSGEGLRRSDGTDSSTSSAATIDSSLLARVMHTSDPMASFDQPGAGAAGSRRQIASRRGAEQDAVFERALAESALGLRRDVTGQSGSVDLRHATAHDRNEDVGWHGSVGVEANRAL